MGGGELRLESCVWGSLMDSNFIERVQEASLISELLEAKLNENEDS